MNKEASISSWQLYFFILQIQVGVGILSLPYKVHEAAGKDGWLSILLAGLFMQVGVLVICLLCSRFPQKTLSDFSPVILGRVIGFFINVLYMLFFFMVASHVLSVFLTITEDWAFPYTPPLIFAVIITAIATYLVKEDIRVIARFHVLMSFFLVVVLVVFIFMWKYLNVYYLLPVGSEGIKNILAGSEKALFSLAGVECLLWVFSMTQADKKAKWKAAAGACLTVTVMYTLLAICTYTYFSREKLMHVPEPVLYMIKSIELGIVERLDLIFLAFWAVFSITTFMSYLYLASLGAAKLVKADHHKRAVYCLGLLIVPLAVYTANDEHIQILGGMISKAAMAFLFGAPLFLLAVAGIRKKREDQS